MEYFNPRGRKDLDLRPAATGDGAIDFNPRGRKDLDYFSMISTADMAISIHEVAKTSTMDISMKIHNICISIHEVAKTSTSESETEEHINGISIHEVAKTSTCRAPFFPISITHFNPRGRKDLDFL